jgi:MFS family permease
VFTEPLWGLSMNLCLPYASVFMLALGLNDVQIGLVASVYLFSQTVFAFLSGVLIDKLGRRLATLVCDALAWALPCLIWASSQGFWFFLVAALFNGTMKVAQVAWDCLLVEDAEREQIPQIYSWVIICGNLSALFAPISSILVAHLTLVPAVRVLYINAFVVMTIKMVLLYRFSRETAVGRIRRAETRTKTWGELLYGYRGVLQQIRHLRGMVFAIVISAIVEVVAMLGMTFWQVIASRRIGLPDWMLPIFPMARSVLAIVFFFTVIGRIQTSKLKWPLYAGFASAIVGCVLLISVRHAGALGYVILCASLVFEALGMALLATLRESLAALHVDPPERSRMLGLLQTVVMLVSVPFGIVGGMLSDVSKALPFVLSIGLLVLGLAVSAWYFHPLDDSHPDPARSPSPESR